MKTLNTELLAKSVAVVTNAEHGNVELCFGLNEHKGEYVSVLGKSSIGKAIIHIYNKEVNFDYTIDDDCKHCYAMFDKEMSIEEFLSSFTKFSNQYN